MTRELFGTDGIRGHAGESPLSARVIHRLGRALVDSGFNHILVGRDTRQSGPWIEGLLSRSIGSAGGVLRCGGILSTPAVAWLTGRFGFDAGIVISASHNPYEDNGIKIFSRHGIKLSDAEELNLESRINQDSSEPGDSRIPESPLAASDPELLESYLAFLRKIPCEGALKGVRVVVDCANGAVSTAAGPLFESLGCEVIEMACKPDGRNINLECGAVHPEHMAALVAQSGSLLGMAFDGDGDRVIMADEKGRIADGDHLLFLLARSMKEHGQLTSGTVVTTVMANLGLEVALREEGLRIIRTAVGDRHVLEAMRQGGHALGGEQSGHVILRDLATTGDGLLVALRVLDLVMQKGRPLSELVGGMTKFPQVLYNIRVREKRDFKSIPEICAKIEEAEKVLGSRGRVLVRYSGTEPKIRVMVEAESEKMTHELAHSIAEAFRKELGS